MNARRFTGASSREVLAKVRDALGPDAMILSNRSTPNGMEVVAVAPGDVNLESTDRAESPRQREAVASVPRALRQRVASPAPMAPVSEPTVAVSVPKTRAAAPVIPLTRGAAAAGDAPATERPAAMNGVLTEIKSMRALLQRELTALNYAAMEQRDPGGMAALRELLGSGLSPVLARGLVKGLPPGTRTEDVMRQVRERMERHLPLSASDHMIEHGGVYALLGPTGVGKTTTVAKLAARAVVRHGAKRVALLTSDSYRIAGFDQLRVYARILGVSLESVRDAGSFSRTLESLKDKHLVLVDTAGSSQRDDMVSEQAAMLSAGGVQRLLLLNATCGTATVDDVISTYRKHGIDGAIVTKADEAASLAAVVEGLLRHKLPLHYVTNGQRVPEDLHLPNVAWLVRRALKLAPGASDYKPAAAELPLMMSGGHGA